MRNKFRVFVIISTLILIAAIPLTVLVAQQQQKVRQYAAETTPTSTQFQCKRVNAECLINESGNNCCAGLICVPFNLNSNNGKCEPGATPTSSVSPTPNPTRTPTPSQTPAPTPAQTSTPTPKPGDTLLALGIGLDGIWNSGTHKNPNGSSSTRNPIRKARVFAIEITGGNNIVKSNPGTLSYDKNKGYFAGIVNLGSSFASGYYIVKVKTDGYLRASIPGIQNIVAGQTSPLLSRVNLTAGDISSDNALDIKDYNILMSCMERRVLCNSTYQILSDLDDNGLVNEFDYNLFLAEYEVQNGD